MFAFVGFSAIKAFIIYEANYDDDSILQLPVAKKDALNLKEALSKIPDSQITLLENPTAGEFIREFKKWINSTTPQDTLIVYYAGHGISKDGKFYFIPADADPEKSLTWISFSNLEKYIKGDRKIVWLIDACYSGALVKGRHLPLVGENLKDSEYVASGLKAGTVYYWKVVAKDRYGLKKESSILGFVTKNILKWRFEAGYVRSSPAVGQYDMIYISSDDHYLYAISPESGRLKWKFETGYVDSSPVIGQDGTIYVGFKNTKPVADISGKIEKLKIELFKAYDIGEISELAFKNTKALIEKKSCEGEGVKDLKEAIDEYLMGKITLKMLILVIKPYGDKITCQGVEKEADISEKIKKLKIELFKAYDAGEISELAFKNTKALIEKKSCEGEGVKDLKEAIDEYLMGKITLKILILVIKPYGDKITCQGVEKQKVEEAKKPSTAFLKLIPANDLAKGAKVYIDGKYAGDIKEDMFIKEVPAGKHSVEITGDKIKDITFNFEVKPYKDYTKEIKAESATGIVKIITDPIGAKLYVDGKEIGESPTFVELEVGKVHKIIAEKEGYTPSTVFVSPNKDKTISVNIKLSLKPEKISLNLPSMMFVGERARISAKAVYPDRTVNLSQNNANIEIHGNTIKLQGDEIIAVKPGTSYITIDHGGLSVKKYINVHYAVLDISSSPAGADIYIDDKYVGRTPKKIPVDSNTVTIKVIKYGYSHFQKKLYVRKGGTKDVYIALKELTRKIVVKAPSSMYKEETANISIEAVTHKNLSFGDVKIQIKGDSIKIENGKIIPVKPGKSTIKVEYKGIVEEKDITILPTNSVSISVGSTMMGELGISTTYNTKLFFASAGYYITPSLFSVEGGVRLSLWILETKLGASYFVGAANPFGIFTEMGIEYAMVEPYVKIIVPVRSISAVDGIPAILYGGVSLNFGF